MVARKRARKIDANQSWKPRYATRPSPDTPYADPAGRIVVGRTRRFPVDRQGPPDLADGNFSGADRVHPDLALAAQFRADAAAVLADRPARLGPDAGRRLHLCACAAGLLDAGLVRLCTQQLRQDRPLCAGLCAGHGGEGVAGPPIRLARRWAHRLSVRLLLPRGIGVL